MVEFAVIAERDTGLLVLVIEGMNLNPHPNHVPAHVNWDLILAGCFQPFLAGAAP